MCKFQHKNTSCMKKQDSMTLLNTINPRAMTLSETGFSEILDKELNLLKVCKYVQREYKWIGLISIA